MSATMIETMLWHIQREIMTRRGVDTSEREIAPLKWYINTGRASTDFLQKLMHTSPAMIARDCGKGGSYDEVIERICHRIKYERGA